MQPSSLSRDISPPPRRRDPSTKNKADASESCIAPKAPSLAAIEAGQAQIRDHLDYFAQHFRSVRREIQQPKLSIGDFQALYSRNQNPHGRHFVVHQHDHPVSGTSLVNPFALMLQADGKNNLIESASHATGSLLIWDTGEYEILPWRRFRRRYTDDEASQDENQGDHPWPISQSAKLSASFGQRRIRIRLHGNKLPENYTISMWLPSTNDGERRLKRPNRKRRRIDPTKTKTRPAATTDDDSNSEAAASVADGPGESSNASNDAFDEETAAAVASEDEEDATIRANNAYPGASNTIGSIHQRYWFLTLDKRNSGFKRTHGSLAQARWIGGFQPLFVRGRDHERSVVTGRNADEVMEDGGVQKFIGRKMWRPILE